MRAGIYAILLRDTATVVFKFKVLLSLLLYLEPFPLSILKGVEFFPKVAIMEKETISYEQSCDDCTSLYFSLATDTRCLPHYHKNIELIYVIEGSFRIIVNGELYQSRYGDIFFIPPHYTHSIEKGNSLSVTLIVPFTQLQPYYETLKDRSLPMHMSDYNFNRITIQPLLKKLVTTPRGNSLLCTGYSQMVLGLLFEHYQSVPLTDMSNSLIVQVIHYMELNAHQDLTLKSVSDHFGYSSFHFSKLFHKYMNCAFRTYLNNIRIRKIAQELNAQSNVVDLAYRNGFKSISTFYRQFHEIFDLSPYQYLARKNSESSAET